MSNTFPEKMYYKIGEVARIASVRTSVLRFWENEFVFLKPDKSSTGQRLYTKKEVELILEVKRLLYCEKYTLEGVRKRINLHGKSLIDIRHPADNLNLLREIRTELQALRYQL